MLTKILFTGLVVVVVLAAARLRANHLARRAGGEPAAAPSARGRATGYLLAGALLLSAVLGYAYFWTRWHEVVTVRVINTRTGETVTYRAHKGSIHEREFQTTDGWKVAVSDQERVEIRHGDE